MAEKRSTSSAKRNFEGTVVKKFNKKLFDNADHIYETKNNVCAVSVATDKSGNLGIKKDYFKKTNDLKVNLEKSYGKPFSQGTRSWFK